MVILFFFIGVQNLWMGRYAIQKVRFTLFYLDTFLFSISNFLLNKSLLSAGQITCENEVGK